MRYAYSTGLHLKPPRILLLYLHHGSSFTACPWLLARDGLCRVDVIAPKSHVVRHSVWVDRHLPFHSKADCIDLLCKTLGSGRYAGMLCVDAAALKLVIEHAHRPELKGYLPFDAGSGLMQAAESKIHFHQWCQQLDISCPHGVSTENSDEIASLADQFDYPFVLKGTHGSGGREVDIVRSRSHLSSLLAHLKDQRGWVLQEYIQGLTGTTMFVSNNRKLYACYSVVNRVCTRFGVGPSAICSFIDDPQLLAIAHKMVAQGGVSGFTGFDWMQTEAGDYKVIDPHFGRVAPNAVMAHLNQVDLGRAYISSLQGGQPVKTAGVAKDRAIWLFPQAFQLLFEASFIDALKHYNPLSKDVRVFLCGKNEWRLFLLQSVSHVAGRLRIIIGRYRKRLPMKLSGKGKLKDPRNVLSKP